MYRLNSRYSSKCLLIDSAYASSYLYDGITTAFTYEFEPISCENDHSFLVSLNSISIPRSWYGVNLSNNKLDVVMSDSVDEVHVNILIPLGNYNSRELADTVQSLLNANSDYGITFKIEYNKITNKYEFQIAASENRIATLLFQSGLNKSQSPRNLFGFNERDVILSTTAQSATISDKCAMMNESLVLFLKCSLVNNMYTSSSSIDNILSSIQINSNINGVVTQSDIASNRFLIQEKSINRMSFSLTDQYNNIVNLNGLHFCFVLKFDVINNIDNQILGNTNVRDEMTKNFDATNLGILSKYKINLPNPYNPYGPSPEYVMKTLKQLMRKNKRINNKKMIDENLNFLFN